MNIYTSTKVMPYVYMGIHKITGEFYIGYREANVRLGRFSPDDLFIYRTSSKVVKPNFDDYDWYIVAEFYTGNDAYDFEQQLIHENWDNPLLLNKRCHYNGKGRFKSTEKSVETKQKMSLAVKNRPPVSEETKQKLSAAYKRRGPISEETRIKISKALRGKTASQETKRKLKEAAKNRPSVTVETRQKISQVHSGRIVSKESKLKMSESQKKRPPVSEETKQKLSMAQTGKIHSEETKKKMSLAKLGKVRKIVRQCSN